MNPVERVAWRHLLYALVRLQSPTLFVAYLQNRVDGNDFVA